MSQAADCGYLAFVTGITPTSIKVMVLTEPHCFKVFSMPPDSAIIENSLAEITINPSGYRANWALP